MFDSPYLHGDLGEPISDLPVYNGEVDYTVNRSRARDIVVIFVFIIFTFVMIVILGSVVSQSKGKIKRLYYPISSKQLICGVDEAVVDKPFLMFDLFNNITSGYCVDDCPSVQHRCYCPDENPTGGNENDCKNISKSCKYFQGDEKDLYIKFQQFCYPPHKFAKYEREDLLQAKVDASSFVTDVKTRGWVVFLSFILPFTISTILILFTVRLVKGFVYVLTVVAIIVSYALAIIFVIISITFFASKAPIQKSTGFFILLIGLGLLVVACITTVVAVRVRSRVSLSVTLLREAGRAVKLLPWIVIIPALLGLLLVIVYALGQVGLVAHSALGEFRIDDWKRVWHIPKIQPLFVFIAILFILWLSYVCLGFVQSVVAGAVASVYFAKELRNIPPSPVFAAMMRTLQYGLGTVCLGSLLLVVTLPLRLVLSLLTLRSTWNVVSQNTCANGCSLFVQKIIRLLQRVSDLYTESGYAWAAIRGDGFHKSCRQTLKLKLRNIIRYSMFDKLCNPAFFYMRLVIILLSTFTVSIVIYPLFIGILTYKGTYVKNWLLIIVINFFLIVTVVYLVFEVYAFAVESLFLCFSIDEEMLLTYDSKRPPYVPKVPVLASNYTPVPPLPSFVTDSLTPALAAGDGSGFATAPAPVPVPAPAPTLAPMVGSLNTSEPQAVNVEEGTSGGGDGGRGAAAEEGAGVFSSTGTGTLHPPYTLFASLELAQFMNELRERGMVKAQEIGFVPPLVVYNREKNLTNLSIIEASRQVAMQQQMLQAQQEAQNAGLIVSGVNQGNGNVSQATAPVNSFIPPIVLSTGGVAVAGVTPTDGTYRPVSLNNETVPGPTSQGFEGAPYAQSSQSAPFNQGASYSQSSQSAPFNQGAPYSQSSQSAPSNGQGGADLLSLPSTVGGTPSQFQTQPQQPLPVAQAEMPNQAQGGEVLYKPNTNL